MSAGKQSTLCRLMQCDLGSAHPPLQPTSVTGVHCPSDLVEGQLFSKKEEKRKGSEML